MKHKLLIGLFLLGLICGGFGELPLAGACAGYTLTVGSDGSQRQELMTQIMAELIRQRTGTKIQMARFKSQAELLAAAERHDVDLLVVVNTQAIDENDLSGEDKLRRLKPFGYQESQVMPAFHAATLKRFPALPRLINRLAGIVDDATLQRLEKTLSTGSDLRALAKQFLTEQNLIFGS